MRILFLTETLPFPLDSGGRIKTYHTLRLLAEKHEVHLHALTRDAGAGTALLRPLCASLVMHRMPRGPMAEWKAAVRALARRMPFTVVRHFDTKIAGAVDADLRRLNPDLVYCDHVSMTTYARRLRRACVCDTHNVEHLLVHRYARQLPPSPRWAAAQLEWRALRQFEREAYAAAAVVMAVSEVDAGAIRELAGSTVCTKVVRVPLDVSSAAPVARLTRAPRLLFVGGLHWPPNLDAVTTFVEDVLPRVRRELPDAELVVAGRDDVAGARRLERCPGVTLAGRVADIVPLLHESRALVVPLRSGSGVRIKILDAFVHGVPVVSTSLGCEGLNVTPGLDLLTADDPGGFAAQVVRVLRDDSLAADLATAGRRFVLSRHDLPVVAPVLADVMELARHLATPGRRTQ